jgi:hypothetical protein
MHPHHYVVGVELQIEAISTIFTRNDLPWAKHANLGRSAQQLRSLL